MDEKKSVTKHLYSQPELTIFALADKDVLTLSVGNNGDDTEKDKWHGVSKDGWIE